GHSDEDPGHGHHSARFQRLLQALSADLLLRVGVLELALGDFLEGHRQVVLRARLDERRRRLLEADAFAELVVVVVDLAGSLGSDDHECVTRIDVVEELIDAGMDHGADMLPAVWSSRWTMPRSSFAARSTSSLTITKSNSSSCSNWCFARSSRFSISPPLSVARARAPRTRAPSRRSSRSRRSHA